MEISVLKMREYQEELKRIEEDIPEITKRKEDARAEGDLSENTEYDIACTELSNAIQRKATLENLINDSTIVEPDRGPRIGLGSFVKVERLNDDSFTSKILRVDNEGDTLAEKPYNRIISINSTLGKAIYNGISGKYTVSTAKGLLEYQVTKIPFDEAMKLFGVEEE